MKVSVETKDLSVVRQGVTILNDVSVAVPAGHVVGLLGPSGAGKTTLMQTLVGLVAPTHGTVKILGQAAGSAALRSKIGYVTQSPSVYADLTVRENLKYFAAMAGARRERVDEVLGDVQMADRAGQLVSTLSGGQEARVSLAVAILGKPQLLVLDEPTVGLDPVLRNELWAMFHRLADGGATLLISSHVMDEATRCESLILLRDGTLLAEGKPADLMSETGTKTIEAAFLKLVEERK